MDRSSIADYVVGYTPLYLGVALSLAMVTLYARKTYRRKQLDFPIADLDSYENGQQALIANTLKYPDTPFVLPYPSPVVVLPMSVLEEVRNLPEEKVSFLKVLRTIFSHKHTGIGDDRPELMKSIKIDLTRNIASTLNDLQEEIRYSFNRELGSCDDWKAVNLYKAITNIVALLSGRVFVGLPTSRSQEWIDATVNYAINCDQARRALTRYPTWTHPFVAPFLPAIRRLQVNKKHGGKILAPILKSVLERRNSEKSHSISSDQEEGTLFSWVLGHMDPSVSPDPTLMYKVQMILAFAAIHTTSQATWHVICDLAARPQYIQPLRDEINRVIEEDGEDKDNDGFSKLKKASMPKLRKLDSFLKESQRLSPPGLISMIRETTAPLTLSTGHTLPKGTRFVFPSYVVHTSTDTQTFSPLFNPPGTFPPTEFDGFRFANLRTVQGQENRHQFVTTSSESLNFGHGNHACPGRFFASNEIKVVLIELLSRWDFRLKGDVEGIGGETKRPKNFDSQMAIIPDVSAEIEFKRRV